MTPPPTSTVAAGSRKSCTLTRAQGHVKVQLLRESAVTVLVGKTPSWDHVQSEPKCPEHRETTPNHVYITCMLIGDG